MLKPIHTFLTYLSNDIFDESMYNNIMCKIDHFVYILAYEDRPRNRKKDIFFSVPWDRHLKLYLSIYI